MKKKEIFITDKFTWLNKVQHWKNNTTIFTLHLPVKLYFRAVCRSGGQKIHRT